MPNLVAVTNMRSASSATASIRKHKQIAQKITTRSPVISNKQNQTKGQTLQQNAWDYSATLAPVSLPQPFLVELPANV